MPVNTISVTTTGAHIFLGRLIEEMQQEGISSIHPSDRLSKGYAVDGERIELIETPPCETLLSEWGGMQFWFDDACDVYVSWSALGADFRFYLDGLSNQQARIVARCVAVTGISIDSTESAGTDIAFRQL